MSLWKIANPHLRNLVVYEPGKPIEDVARELGLEPSAIIKLASNENPLGPSPKGPCRHARCPHPGSFLSRWQRLSSSRSHRKKFGFARENVILGNGSNEIIEFIGHGFLKPGDEVITAAHAFAVYPIMAALFGAKTIEVPDPDFKHDLDAMADAIAPRIGKSSSPIRITQPARWSPKKRSTGSWIAFPAASSWFSMKPITSFSMNRRIPSSSSVQDART